MTPPASPSRSRLPVILGIVVGLACLGLVLVLVIAAVAGGLFFARGAKTESGAAPASATEMPLPPGVSEGEPYLELSSSADGPVVDVYLDFLCPHCATFEDAQGTVLQELAVEEEITLRVHPRSMLDASSTPAGYSGRAANAAVCAYAVDPAHWYPVSAALFENQPDIAGLTDEELAAVVSESTGADVTDCIAEGTYVPWIEDVVEAEALETTPGTPAIYIDGEQFTGDYTEPGALAEAIATA